MAEDTAKRWDLARLADLLFEAGMLRKTPRTGYQFLGSGSENVAEHSFRTALIGFALANVAGANPEHTAMLGLIHDFHEARTGDFNYVNSIYNQSRAKEAMEDALSGTGLDQPIMGLWEEQDKEETLEARLAHDADQLDLVLNLVEQLHLGNTLAGTWIENCLKRLRTAEGQALARTILQADPSAWWFSGQDSDWWVNKGK